MNHRTKFHLHIQSWTDGGANGLTEMTVHGPDNVLAQVRKHLGNDLAADPGTKHFVRATRLSDGRCAAYDTKRSWRDKVDVLLCTDVKTASESNEIWLGRFGTVDAAHRIAVMALDDVPAKHEVCRIPRLPKAIRLELYKLQLKGRGVAGAFATDKAIADALVERNLGFYAYGGSVRGDVHLNERGAQVVRCLPAPAPRELAVTLNKSGASFMRDMAAGRGTGIENVAKVHSSTAVTLCGFGLCRLYARNENGSDLYQLTEYGVEVADALVSIEDEREAKKAAKAEAPAPTKKRAPAKKLTKAQLRRLVDVVESGAEAQTMRWDRDRTFEVLVERGLVEKVPNLRAVIDSDPDSLGWTFSDAAIPVVLAELERQRQEQGDIVAANPGSNDVATDARCKVLRLHALVAWLRGGAAEDRDVLVGAAAATDQRHAERHLELDGANNAFRHGGFVTRTTRWLVDRISGDYRPRSEYADADRIDAVDVVLRNGSERAARAYCSDLTDAQFDMFGALTDRADEHDYDRTEYMFGGDCFKHLSLTHPDFDRVEIRHANGRRDWDAETRTERKRKRDAIAALEAAGYIVTYGYNPYDDDDKYRYRAFRYTDRGAVAAALLVGTDRCPIEVAAPNPDSIDQDEMRRLVHDDVELQTADEIGPDQDEGEYCRCPECDSADALYWETRREDVLHVRCPDCDVADMFPADKVVTSCGFADIKDAFDAEARQNAISSEPEQLPGYVAAATWIEPDRDYVDHSIEEVLQLDLDNPEAWARAMGEYKDATLTVSVYHNEDGTLDVSASARFRASVPVYQQTVPADTAALRDAVNAACLDAQTYIDARNAELSKTRAGVSTSIAQLHEDRDKLYDMNMGHSILAEAIRRMRIAFLDGMISAAKSQAKALTATYTMESVYEPNL